MFQMGDMEGLLVIYQVSEESRDLVFWLIIFHTLCIRKSSATYNPHPLDSSATTKQENYMHITAPESNEGLQKSY